MLYHFGSAKDFGKGGQQGGHFKRVALCDILSVQFVDQLNDSFKLALLVDDGSDQHALNFAQIVAVVDFCSVGGHSIIFVEVYNALLRNGQACAADIEWESNYIFKLLDFVTNLLLGIAILGHLFRQELQYKKVLALLIKEKNAAVLVGEQLRHHIHKALAETHMSALGQELLEGVENVESPFLRFIYLPCNCQTVIDAGHNIANNGK